MHHVWSLHDVSRSVYMIYFELAYEQKQIKGIGSHQLTGQSI